MAKSPATKSVSSRSGRTREGDLSLRALNRALLARQMLLQRAEMPAAKALEHLVGLQAQSPFPPYFGLWTRLQDFHAEELSQLIECRKAVRMSLMRSTIHLVTAKDSLALRPILQAIHETQFHTGSRHGPAIAGADIEKLLKIGRKLIEEKPLTFTALGTRLQEYWP